MAEKNERGSGKTGLLRRGRHWAKARDVAFYMLWFEFLKISPSYALAHRMRAGMWTVADEGRKPADFAAVLAVYDDLGDVRSRLFKEWWLETAIPYFGYSGEKPRMARIGTAQQKSKNNVERLTKGIETYLRGRWREQGEQRTAIVAIPIGLPRAQLTKQLAALLETYPEDMRVLNAPCPKYELIKRKLDSKSLFRYIMCVWAKARFPKLALWRIGVHAKISATYSGQLKADAKFVPHQHTDARNALKILTSRAISRGLLIAENAARGHFPTYAPLQAAVTPDWNDLGVAVKQRTDLDKRAKEADIARKT